MARAPQDQLGTEFPPVEFVAGVFGVTNLVEDTLIHTVLSVLTAIGALVVGGGAITGLSLWLFKTFASRWLDQKFARELEEFRHGHQTELQRLRLQIDTLLDRTIKLHAKEFEVLPEAWSLLSDAFSETQTIAMAFVQYPNVSGMTGRRLDEFLEGTQLANWQKDELRSATDKNRYYADALQWQGLNCASKARNRFHSYIIKNGIFIPDDIREKFFAINDLMIHAFVERQMSLSYPNLEQKFDAAQALSRQGAPIVEVLQKDLHDRLWSSTKTDPAEDGLQTR